MQRASSVLLPFSGGSPKRVSERWRKYARTADAAAVLAMPADHSSIDLTWRNAPDFVAAFDAVEQAGRVLNIFRETLDGVSSDGRSAREQFRRFPKDRERLQTLTRSAAHFYMAFAQSALDQLTVGRVLTMSFDQLGELIVMAVDILEHTARQAVRYG